MEINSSDSAIESWFSAFCALVILEVNYEMMKIHHKHTYWLDNVQILWCLFYEGIKCNDTDSAIETWIYNAHSTDVDCIPSEVVTHKVTMESRVFERPIHHGPIKVMSHG